MKTKLELTWIGKENRPKLEPRILIEESEKSYCAQARHSADIFDNKLIFGDNLLALKALEAEYAGQVKCIFIDPPYNTGSAFEHYDDGIEHSLWLSLMRDRLQLIRRLLSESGTLWVSLDDNESHYFKVMADEVFGRDCYVGSVIWRSTDNSNNDAKTFSVDHNYVLVYSRTSGWLTNKLSDDSKRGHFRNPDNDPRGPYFDGNPLNSPKPRPNLTYDILTPNGNVIKPPANGWRWSKETLWEKISSGEIRFTPDYSGIRRRTYLADMKGLPPSTLWSNLDETGHNRQAKYELKNLFPSIPTSELFGTPKPERLIQKVLEISTEYGDIVLDSFLGSGTTAAVAHKMGRRWIGIELGEHCHTHCIPRLKKVIDGEDPGGISEAAGWKGGGGFRYYRLAPSLLEQDKWGNWVISKEYNAAMLAEALCKLEGFRYEPSPSVYWMHGRSSEHDFLYATTQNLSPDQLQALSDEVGPSRSLLVLCAAYRGDGDKYPNLTLKKIPKTVLAKCEWGHDDYSLKIENLPKAPESQAPAPVNAGRKSKAKSSEPDLFGEDA
jgi:adenine-specific DNA-methyltransferase